MEMNKRAAEQLLKQRLGPHPRSDKPLEPHLTWPRGEQVLHYTSCDDQGDSPLSQTSLGPVMQRFLTRCLLICLVNTK